MKKLKRSEVSRRRALYGAAALIAAPAVISSPARAQAKITWRVQSHWPKASASFEASLVPLAKELERRTKGQFRLDPMGAGEIAQGAEVFNVVRRGVVPMGTTTAAYNPDESPLMQMYHGLPGTLRETWQMMHLTKNLGLEDAINETLQKKGVFFRAEKVYPTHLSLKAPITEGQDLGGIKIRTVGPLLKFFSAAGFVTLGPQQIAGTEIYQALATGVVDGANWGGAQGSLSMKFWEVAKYFMMPAVGVNNDLYVINRKAYDALPEDFRLILDSLLNERYFSYSIEYILKERIALNTGIDQYGVKVQEFPVDVQKKFAVSASEILKAEMAKSPENEKAGKVLIDFMGQLGYPI